MKSEVFSIKSLLAHEAKSVTVKPVRDGKPFWEIQNGQLVNKKANFFSVCAFQTSPGEFNLFLDQPSNALVVLLVKRVKEDLHYLLKIRSEPGLIGITCLTTTIQSSGANYKHEHGGKQTPYLECVEEQERYLVLHDSEQYDWGDAYLGKRKRFLIIETENVDAEDGYLWVSQAVVDELTLSDHLITNDLRAILAMLPPKSDEEGEDSQKQELKKWEHYKNHVTHRAASLENRRVDLVDLQEIQDGRTVYFDSFGNLVSFFHTSSPNREIPDWVQPLLKFKKSKTIDLYRLLDKGIESFALLPHSQIGLSQERTWTVSVPTILQRGEIRGYLTSAEGGRFYRQEVAVSVVTLNRKANQSPRVWPEETTFLSKKEVQCLIESPLATTVELRMAWSFLLSLQREL